MVPLKRIYRCRNGNRKIFPISVNTASSVKPIILKGSRISHTSGKKININNARGQQSTSSTHQRANAINVLIVGSFRKRNTNYKNGCFYTLQEHGFMCRSKCEQFTDQKCTVYSERRHCTGFTLAALIACDATVIHAMSNAMSPPVTKYQAESSM